MKKKMLILRTSFICAVLTLSAANVYAGAVSTSIATIDWTSLAITGDITWNHQGSQSYAYAEDNTGWDADGQGDDWWGWITPTSASASTLHASGDAYTNDANLYEEVYAIAIPWANTEAGAERWGDFTADSNGYVTFSVDYYLSQDLDTDSEGEWAYGSAAAVLWLTHATGPEDSDPAVLENLVSDGASMTDWDSGTLMVTLWFDKNESGAFVAGVYNVAEVEVPEPATIALLGFGALTLLRRRKA